MRTTTEIMERYRSKSDSDIFRHVAEILWPYLSANDVAVFMRPDADLSDWEQCELIDDTIRDNMQDYMTFAWDKATGHRGLSASRSIDKFAEQLWLLGDEKLVAFAETVGKYAQSGVPVLKRICEQYGFAIPGGDNVTRMSEGLPCMPGCRNGCC